MLTFLVKIFKKKLTIDFDVALMGSKIREYKEWMCP